MQGDVRFHVAGPQADSDLKDGAHQKFRGGEEEEEEPFRGKWFAKH